MVPDHAIAALVGAHLAAAVPSAHEGLDLGVAAGALLVAAPLNLGRCARPTKNKKRAGEQPATFCKNEFRVNERTYTHAHTHTARTNT